MAADQRFVVGGDQAIRIARASAELNRQLFLQSNGCKLDPEKVIATFQGMTEGKLTPFGGGLRGRFIRTMPILIGGVPKLDLIEQVKAVRELGSYAESMIRHDKFETLEQEEEAIQIDLSPAELGFTEPPLTPDLLNEQRLADWSGVNFNGWAIGLNHVSTGPHVAIQYKDQPKGEVLWVASKPTPDSNGNPSVFNVEREDDGGSWLFYAWAYPAYQWPLGNRLLFRLRNSLHFSLVWLAASGEFCFCNCPAQPPSIFPTSSIFVESTIYFLSRSDLVSHNSISNTLSVSSLRIARDTKCSFLSLGENAAPATASTVSINKISSDS